MSTKRFLNGFGGVAHCVRIATDPEVQSGLALTPSQIYDMASRGLPVTVHNLGVTYDEGYSNLDFVPPLNHRRGVDLADAFEARQDAKHKLRTLRDEGRFNVNVEPNAE